MKRRAALDDVMQDNLIVANGLLSLAHRPAHLENMNRGVELPVGCQSTIMTCVDTANKSSFSPIKTATDAFDTALEDVRVVTPPNTPRSKSEEQSKPPLAKQPSTRKKARHASSSPRLSSSLPTKSDPADETFIKSLYSAKDKGKINPAHNIVRRDVLDVRRTISGKVYLQCRHCAHIPRTKRGTKCSTVAPQSIAGIYRAVGRIMMFHLRHCEHVPQEMKELDPKATRDVKVTGTKKTWVESAKRMGLKDAEEGIIYCCPTTKN